MEKVSEMCIVYVTAKTFENASQIAKIIVNEKLAACCSIIQNVASVYGWQGNIQERHEYLMMIKTAQTKLDDLEARVKEMALDEVPEIIVVGMQAASATYLEWIRQSLD